MNRSEQVGEGNVGEAVQMLMSSILGAISARKAAVSVLLDNKRDADTAVMSALTMSFAVMLVVTTSDAENADAAYARGVAMMAKMLRDHRDNARACARELMR